MSARSGNAQDFDVSHSIVIGDLTQTAIGICLLFTAPHRCNNNTAAGPVLPTNADGQIPAGHVLHTDHLLPLFCPGLCPICQFPHRKHRQ